MLSFELLHELACAVLSRLGVEACGMPPTCAARGGKAVSSAYFAVKKF